MSTEVAGSEVGQVGRTTTIHLTTPTHVAQAFHCFLEALASQCFTEERDKHSCIALTHFASEKLSFRASRSHQTWIITGSSVWLRPLLLCAYRQLPHEGMSTEFSKIERAHMSDFWQKKMPHTHRKLGHDQLPQEADIKAMLLVLMGFEEVSASTLQSNLDLVEACTFYLAHKEAVPIDDALGLRLDTLLSART